MLVARLNSRDVIMLHFVVSFQRVPYISGINFQRCNYGEI